MSEIEKMYKTIFGELAPNCGLCAKLIDCKIINNTHNCNKFKGDYKSLFTAEKQLKLIKWLMTNTKDYQYDVENGKYWFFIDEYRETKYRDFDEALAELINLYWQSLTEEEKEQIKRILEIEI